MGQSLDNLHHNINIINQKLLSHKKCQIQRIMSTPHFLCLQCRIPGETFYMYLGRGAMYQGLYISKNKPSVNLRVKDRFLEFARKYWRDCNILNVLIDKDDRVFKFSCMSKKYKLEVLLFWRGRDLFFVQLEKTSDLINIFKSWEGHSVTPLDNLKNLNSHIFFDDLGYAKESKKNKNDTFNIEDYLSNESSEKDISKEVNRINKKNNTLKDKLLSELKMITDAIELSKHVEDDLEKIDTIGHGRFTVKLYKVDGHYKKRDLLYEKVKQWKKSKEIIETRLEGIKNKIINKDDFIKKNKKIISPIWVNKKNKEAITKNENYIEFTFLNYKCFLGRNSFENDYIRNKISKKDDIWFHVDQAKSGHLFVRGETPTVSDIEILGSAMCELCNLKFKEVSLIYTKVANLKGLKGSRGSVTFKKEKRITIYFNQEWKKLIKDVNEIESQ